jgi:hypothetical protein
MRNIIYLTIAIGTIISFSLRANDFKGPEKNSDTRGAGDQAPVPEDDPSQLFNLPFWNFTGDSDTSGGLDTGPEPAEYSAPLQTGMPYRSMLTPHPSTSGRGRPGQGQHTLEGEQGRRVLGPGRRVNAVDFWAAEESELLTRLFSSTGSIPPYSRAAVGIGPRGLPHSSSRSSRDQRASVAPRLGRPEGGLALRPQRSSSGDSLGHPDWSGALFRDEVNYHNAPYIIPQGPDYTDYPGMCQLSLINTRRGVV